MFMLLANFVFSSNFCYPPLINVIGAMVTIPIVSHVRRYTLYTIMSSLCPPDHENAFLGVEGFLF